MDKIKFMHPLVPKIVILENSNEKSIVECINRSVVSILKSPIDFENLKLSVIIALNQSKRADKILLKEGVYYDAYRERFYNSKGAIPFTKFEFLVIKLLLDNHDKIINHTIINHITQ